MQYDMTTDFGTYLTNKLSHGELNKINLAIGGNRIYFWTKQHSIPSDDNLITLSEISQIDLRELYWMRLTPKQRQHSSVNASLSLVTRLMEYRYMASLKANDLANQMHISTGMMSMYMRLAKPFSSQQLKQLAQIYHISVKVLTNQCEPLKMDDNYTPYRQIRMAEDPLPPLVKNIRKLIAKYPKLESIVKIAKESHTASTFVYKRNPEALKYAKLIANYFDMNLHALLVHGQTHGNNQLYEHAKHYLNQRKMSFHQLERQLNIPYGFIKTSVHSTYLDSLVKLSLYLKIPIDELFDPNMAVPSKAKFTKQASSKATNPVKSASAPLKSASVTTRATNTRSTTASLSESMVDNLIDAVMQTPQMKSLVDAASSVKTKQMQTASVANDEQLIAQMSEFSKLMTNSKNAETASNAIDENNLSAVNSLYQNLMEQAANTVNSVSSASLAVQAANVPEIATAKLNLKDQQWLNLIHQLDEKQQSLLENILITWTTNK